MCNLYAMTSNQAAIRRLFAERGDALDDAAGDLRALAAVFPDMAAPIVRHRPAEDGSGGGVGEGLQLAMARWGMPSPAFALRGRRTDGGVTNIRNAHSPHWRRWLGPAHRCLVPVTSFCEYDARPGRGKAPVWFAAAQDRPLMVFAGLWTRWTSVRKLPRRRDDRRPLRLPHHRA